MLFPFSLCVTNVHINIIRFFSSILVFDIFFVHHILEVFDTKKKKPTKFLNRMYCWVDILISPITAFFGLFFV